MMHNILFVLFHDADFGCKRSQSYFLQDINYEELQKSLVEECKLVHLMCDVFVYQVTNACVSWKFIECISADGDTDGHKFDLVYEYYENHRELNEDGTERL